MVQMLSPDPSSPFQIIEEDPMLIRLASVMVENQDSALPTTSIPSTTASMLSGSLSAANQKIASIIAILFEDTCGNLINLAQPGVQLRAILQFAAHEPIPSAPAVLLAILSH
jgi:hypothetical protein